MRVLFVDPWGIGETGEYTNGICGELQKLVDLTLVTNYYFENKAQIADVRKLFFKRSQKMGRSILRKLVRGFEYIRVWKKILKLAKKENYDIIHINWLLMYKFDCRILKRIKKYNNKIVYTAHNVIPHINGEQFIPQLKKIYGLSDRIIIHGEELKTEFAKLFPQDTDKLYVQKHGCNKYKDVSYDSDSVPEEIKNKFSDYERRALFLGNVFYGKGADRLLTIWLENAELENVLLVIAGRVTEKDSDWAKRYDELKQQALNRKNIIILNYFVPDNTANFLIDNSDILVLPYREASMSGVVFTAADFAKPILATKVGALHEYIEDCKGFLTDSTEDAIKEMLINIFEKYSKKQLKSIGFEFKKKINELYSWDNVVNGLYCNCYQKIIYQY